jgi:hypothetical protein
MADTFLHLPFHFHFLHRHVLEGGVLFLHGRQMSRRGRIQNGRRTRTHLESTRVLYAVALRIIGHLVVAQVRDGPVRADDTVKWKSIV